MSASMAPRALVTDDTEEAHSWWACKLVCDAWKRPPPLMMATAEHAAPMLTSCGEPVMLNASQARALASIFDQDAASHDAPFSREYVYSVAALMDCTDRVFRKACRRAEAVLEERALAVNAYAIDAPISDGLIGRCMHCRNIWLERRARAAKYTGGGRARPPWAGLPRRSHFLCALKERRLVQGGSPADVALFVISAAATSTRVSTDDGEPGGGSRSCPGSKHHEHEDRAPSTAAVVGYVLTERVGRTIVAIDGVHDYSVCDADPRADPSALLLHAAANWWAAHKRDDGRMLADADHAANPAPIWMNDGPVPTQGLLKYKSQYHRSGGTLMYLFVRKPALAPELRAAAARVRWATLLAKWRRSQGLHVSAPSIRRAAQRIYSTGANGRGASA